MTYFTTDGREREAEPGPVVYYAQMGANVKIGYSIDLRRRMKTMYVQRDLLLAVEPGGRKVERERHLLLVTYRIKGTELFMPNRILSEIIEGLRAERPDPW